MLLIVKFGPPEARARQEDVTKFPRDLPLTVKRYHWNVVFVIFIPRFTFTSVVKRSCLLILSVLYSILDPKI